jgi:hypothetical protein
MFAIQVVEQQLFTIDRAVVAVVFPIWLMQAHGATFATACRQVFATVRWNAGGIPQHRIWEPVSNKLRMSFGGQRAPKHIRSIGYHRG